MKHEHHPTVRRIRRFFHRNGLEVQVQPREPGLEIKFSTDFAVTLAQFHDVTRNQKVWHLLISATGSDADSMPDMMEVPGSMTTALSVILKMWRAKRTREADDV
jgi:hypothetical protein